MCEWEGRQGVSKALTDDALLPLQPQEPLSMPAADNVGRLLMRWRAGGISS